MPSFEAERSIEARQVLVRLREIEETIYADKHPIPWIEYCVTGLGKGPERAPKTGWQPFEVHQRWGGFDQTTWFRMRVQIPAALEGRHVVALIRPGGESLAYVNGKPVQGLDPNRDTITLTDKAARGETYEIALESVPSVRFDEHHYFAYADIAAMEPLAWSFYWDCRVVLDVCEHLDGNFAPQRRLMELLNTAVKSVDLQHKRENSYKATLAKAQRMLRRELKQFEASFGMGKLVLAGQTHIDTAWLWPLRETKRKCGRTFSTVLTLLDRYPEFYFVCSQPVQYEWMKEHYPEQFERIKHYVKAGRWEPLGAMWVEPDCNIPSGESLVRQLLYGNRFFRREFGVQSRLAWLPDAFGYTWSLPQILKKAQVETFVTTKIAWSRFTEFPYDLFQWEGADGTRVLGLMPPLNYNGMLTVGDCVKHWNLFKQKERVEELPYPVGYGDGGGGPTPKMIETGMRLKNIVGIPKCEFGRVQDCVDRMLETSPLDTLPVFNGELYLELHRACQTSQARTKRNNRKMEMLLRDAEFFSAAALMNGGPYDQETLDKAWKTVLTNQFHDILPGSSITEVYTQADIDYAEARTLAEGVQKRALTFLTKQIDTQGEGAPVLVFNTLSWVRDGVVEVSADLPKSGFSVIGPDGAAAAYQRLGEDRLLFEVKAVPPLGYTLYRVVPGNRTAEPSDCPRAAGRTLENACLRIQLDRKGRIQSIYDKTEDREVVPKGQRANILQMFDDRPHNFDAWEMDHNFDELPLDTLRLQSVEAIENGPLRAVLRVAWKSEKSAVTQDIVLTANSARVDFVTTVDWHERHVLLKTAFPVDVRAARAAYEIQFAAIERATHTNTAWDRARFEVPAQRWADLSEGDYGVSLLNDCKYGYDVRGNVLRLSLLRAPVDPDPEADQGLHAFTYALYPHGGDWRNGTVLEGFELNAPMHAVAASPHKGTLPAAEAFLSIDADNVLADTVKKHEDSGALIVRLYEAYGQRGDVAITFGRTPRKVVECDLMEENDEPVDLKGHTVRLYVTPYVIRTLKVEF